MRIFPYPFTLQKLLPIIILAGGFGTRLQSVVDDRPKVLAPVAGKPFLQHLLTRLAAENVDDVVVSTGYLGEQIDAFVASATPEGMRVRCVREPGPLGTGGALAFAAGEAGITGPFVAMNGDTFFGGSVAKLVEALHLRPDAGVIVAITQVDAIDRYGCVLSEEPDPAGLARVTGFSEKAASVSESGRAWINAGVYVLSPRALENVAVGEKVSLERDVFPRLVEQGALWALRYPDAPFLDIGTPEDYARAEAMLV